MEDDRSEKMKKIVSDNSVKMLEDICKADFKESPFTMVSACTTLFTSGILISLILQEKMSKDEENKFLDLFFNTVKENIQEMKERINNIKDEIIAVEV